MRKSIQIEELVVFISIVRIPLQNFFINSVYKILQYAQDKQRKLLSVETMVVSTRRTLEIDLG